MPPIYLDNAASTRVTDDVLALMTEVMRTAWGNPSSAHPQGAAARAYLAVARTRLLGALGDPKGTRGDLVWTSGCSEADALAVLGAAHGKPGPIVVSSIEHPAVTATAARGRRGAEGRNSVVEVAPRPGAGAVIDPDDVAKAVADHGANVVAIVMVQNDLGVVQPIREIAAAIRAAAPRCHIHVDAAQALGKLPVDVTVLDVDSIALAGHKLGGPKGVGALWLRAGAVVEPLWVGGGHQGGLRGGTQDAPGAAGMGLAAEQAVQRMSTARMRWLELAGLVMDRLAGLAQKLVPDQRRSPHILALGIAGVSAGALRNVLASRGVYISTGSACAAGHDSKPSPVLAAIDLPDTSGMCRLSFAHDTTTEEVTEATAILADVIRELRKG